MPKRAPKPSNKNNRTVATAAPNGANTYANKNVNEASNGHSGEPTVAKAGVRMVAIVYDGMLILALLFLVGTLLTVLGTFLTMDTTGTTSQQAQPLPAWYQNLVMTPSFILTLIGFYGVFWRRGGQTLGMQTWRLKTVSMAGHYLTWRQVAKRIVAACVVPLLCAVVGWFIHGSRHAVLGSAILGLFFNYIFCAFNRRGLAVHDMLSNTITLKVPKVKHEGLLQSFRKRKSS